MQKHRHFIVYKPLGYLSQFVNNQTSSKRKKLLGELFEFPEGTMAIGRLDEKSEGLLLLTTDGVVSEQVRSKKIEKEYFVELDGDITNVAIGQLECGVEIGFSGKKYMTLPCKVTRLHTVPNFEPELNQRKRHRPTSWISVIITEGKFRQVRKMTAAVGFPTLRLIRVRVGNIRLDKLVAGEIIEVEDFMNYPT